jgi:hypothetical protein
MNMTTNTDQNILCFKVLGKLIAKMNQMEASAFLQRSGVLDVQLASTSHESKLSNAMNMGVVILLRSETQEQAVTYIQNEIKSATEEQAKTLSPNLQEQIRLLAVVGGQLRSVDSLPS